MPVRLALTCCLLATLAAPAARGADTKPAGDARAADFDPNGPRGAMKSFYEAMEASDAAAVRALFHAATDDEKQLADAYANLLTAARALGESAKAKYGATGDALSKGMPVKDEIAKLSTAKEEIKGDTATVQTNPKGKPLRLVRGDGGRWRLAVADYAGATPETIAGQTKVLKDITAVFTGVSADISADKFQTAADAQRVLQQKLQAVVFNTVQKNPPTTGRATTKPKP